MSGNGRLSGKRERAALFLAAGRTMRGTAKALSLGETTLYRWRADADFRARVDEIRKQLFDRSVGQIARAMPVAAAKLLKIVKGGPDKLALAAAGKLLDTGLKIDAILDHEERLAELESFRQQLEQSPCVTG